MQKTNSCNRIELVRFRFPKDPELSLYALATLQSLVESYRKSSERLRLWSANPELVREIKVLVYCEQKFFWIFRDSMPAESVYYMLAPELEREPDELLIDLSEAKLQDMPDVPGYSIQWWMGQVAGVKPKMLPNIKQQFFVSAYGTPIYGSRVFWRKHNSLYMDEYQINRLSSDVVERVAQARYVVAEQSFVSVLATALGKPVVEITPKDSRQVLLMYPNYVQVSRMEIDTFLNATIERALSCLLNRLSQSAASSVQGESSISQPQPELQQQPVNSALGAT